MLIRLGPRNIDATRYVRMRRADRGGEPRLQVFLNAPRDVVTVTGVDVAVAVDEVNQAMAELDRERMGGGWVNLDGTDDDE